MTNKDDFFGDGYEIPVNPSKYAKIEKDKELRIRILGKPLIGWGYFDANKKPHRQKEKFEELVNPSISQFTSKPNPQREFWAFKVYNINTKCIEIFETNKQTIKQLIMDLHRDDDYGAPTGYDLKIRKDGTGTDTEYKVLPGKVEPLSVEGQELAKDTFVNLENLFKGEDPFED